MTARGDEAERVESVVITRASARRGDVLVVGGRPMRVENVVRTITGARLDFPGGERMWLTDRSEFGGTRTVVEGGGGL
ncbi:hypothetical protein [Streptomyces sp. ST2-7A]|uniref:hypothetical protein n=1 Tax=Streptomyces sp. ST2-7A TaxID=2907214 RepID=UPI001F3B9FA7|nr:hypothetical protein [Streptomyces sp. ST2-7A]MCE7081424.1 hypothetical protein [Streptomyces sp. ST2-7A]